MSVSVIVPSSFECLSSPYIKYNGVAHDQWHAFSVMMLSKSYGMFWVQTQPCTPE